MIISATFSLGIEQCSNWRQHQWSRQRVSDSWADGFKWTLVSHTANYSSFY